MAKKKQKAKSKGGFSAPKKVTWWIAFLLLLVGGVLFILSIIPVVIPTMLAGLAGWLLLAAGVLYAVSTAMKGL